MKSQERHKLKENEFARTVVHAREVLATRQRDIDVGGRRHRRVAGDRRRVRVVAAVDRQPRHRPPRKRAGRLRGAGGARRPHPRRAAPLLCSSPAPIVTEQAKLEAALPKFLEAADRYPSTQAGIAARYHAAGILATLGRYQRGGTAISGSRVDEPDPASTDAPAASGSPRRRSRRRSTTARSRIYTELSRDTSSQMPVDGVLMQLGRACALAGRKEEAVRAFTRVTEEFPTSLYFDGCEARARRREKVVARQLSGDQLQLQADQLEHPRLLTPEQLIS